MCLLNLFLSSENKQNKGRIFKYSLLLFFSGPPQAEQREIKRVGRIGEKIKLVCPIGGFPAPQIEWSKDGEKIDWMWDERFKTGRKSLKILNANEDDTGIYHCKGINGFGSESVRVELIVVHPTMLPKGLNGRDRDVAPPIFTRETSTTPKSHTLNVGETFKVSCEALGSPQPEIFWFKDGQHIDENVHFQRGRSTVEFEVMGTADAGTYSCRARNLIGEATANFSLNVNALTGSDLTQAIVTEAGPSNTVVKFGEDATLQCRIRARSPPNIKWLKKLEPNEASGQDTLRVRHERYRILHTMQDVEVGANEYLNKLTIRDVTSKDSGLYICFVTNSGFRNTTYKSMTLSVVKDHVVNNNDNIRVVRPDDPRDRNGSSDKTLDSSLPVSVLVIVICLSTAVVVLLIVLISYGICKRKQNSKDTTVDTRSNSTSSSGSDVDRPFMRPPQPLKPLPPTPMWSTTNGNKLYPVSDSGFASGGLPADTENGNHYEAPYAQLLPTAAPSIYRPREDIFFTQEAFSQPQSLQNHQQPRTSVTMDKLYYPQRGQSFNVNHQRAMMANNLHLAPSVRRMPYYSDYDGQP